MGWSYTQRYSEQIGELERRRDSIESAIWHTEQAIEAEAEELAKMRRDLEGLEKELKEVESEISRLNNTVLPQ